MLQAWALPIENIIGGGGFVFALTANPLTSGVGREGSPGCSASSVPLEWFRLSLIEDVSEIKIEEKRFRRQLRFEGDVRERRCFERRSDVEETEGVESDSSRPCITDSMCQTGAMPPFRSAPRSACASAHPHSRRSSPPPQSPLHPDPNQAGRRRHGGAPPPW